jgi:hypothetical protein
MDGARLYTLSSNQIIHAGSTHGGQHVNNSFPRLRGMRGTVKEPKLHG